MIEFHNISNITPYKIFKEKYEEALNAGQKNIEAISIASFNKEKDEVDSRFVNLKFIENDKFIFFSNYNSPKALAFETNDQISALMYWSSVNIQIRIKAHIKKTSVKYNKLYFKNRSIYKNALAISSNQSRKISSFAKVKSKYNKVMESNDLTLCPEHWGGFTFAPYSFEFWEGHKSRLNKRNLYKKNKNQWSHYILEP